MSSSFYREARSIVLPLWRWSPLIVALVTVGLVVAGRAISYMTPMYRASGTIQIDNRDFGIETFQIFAQGTVPKAASSGLTEIEVLQSRTLVRQALDTLGWMIRVARIGELRTSELYEDMPFSVTIGSIDSTELDRPFEAEYIGNGFFSILKKGEKAAALAPKAHFGESFEASGQTFVFEKNQKLLAAKINALRIGDRFEIEAQSMEKRIDAVLGKELFIKPIDKEATLIQVVYSDPVAQKASDFVRALLDAYIIQSRDAKRQQANETLRFLDSQLLSVTQHLRGSEAGLADYRSNLGLTTTELEMDAAMKERMTHNLRGVNYDIQKAELAHVAKHLRSGESLERFSPNFEAINDAVFKDAYIRAQNLELQKQDLLMRFTLKSEEVLTAQSKINQLRMFLNETIGHAISNIDEKQRELGFAVHKIEKNLQRLPEQQRRETSLSREVRLNEQLYEHLLEKRTELAIAATSSETFHRIIDYPSTPTTPYSPNRSILFGLTVLCALILGMAMAYSLHGRTARACSTNDLLFLDQLPVIGQAYALDKKQPNAPTAIADLIADLSILIKKSPNAQTIALLSARPGEGKTFLAFQIAQSFAAAGHRTLLVDADPRKADLAALVKRPNFGGLSELMPDGLRPSEAVLLTDQLRLHFIPSGEFHDGCTSVGLSLALDRLLEELRPAYDLIVIDAPPIELLPDALPIAQKCDYNFLVVRSRRTPLAVVRRTAQTLIGLGTPSVYFLLNAAQPDRRRRKILKKIYPQPVRATSLAASPAF